MVGDVIAVDAISCWAECQPVPPCHRQSPASPGSRGDWRFSRTRPLAFACKRPRSVLDQKITISTSQCPPSSGNSFQHVLSGRDNTVFSAIFLLSGKCSQAQATQGVSLVPRVLKTTVNRPIRDTDNDSSGILTCLGYLHIVS